LSLKLKGFEKEEELKDAIQALNEEVVDTKNELDNLKNLQKPAKLGLSGGQDEFEQSITQFQLSTDEGEQLQVKRNKEIQAQELTNNLRELGIEHYVGSYNNIVKLDALRQRLGDDRFMRLANSIYEQEGTDVRVLKFLDQMEQISNRDYERNFREEEQLQRQIIEERVSEDEYENNQSRINQIKNDMDNNKSELDKKKTRIENKRNELESYTDDLNEVKREYDNLISTLESELDRNDIDSIDEVDDIEDELDKESLLALWSYIDEQSGELNSYIEKMENRIKLQEEDIINLENDYDDDKKKYEEQLEEYERISRSLN